MAFDIGVNLTSQQYQNYVGVVFHHMRHADVQGVITISNRQKDWQHNIDIINKYSFPHIGMTAGVHPHNAKEVENCQLFMDTLENFVRTHINQVKAIGECGLDYNRMFSTKEQQIKVFQMQIDLAAKLDLPLYLHEREAHEDFYAILEQAKTKYPQLRGVVHCFTGSKEVMQRYLNLGLYIGITGWICDDLRNGALMDAVQQLFAKYSWKMMLETDSPWLSPPTYFSDFKGHNDGRREKRNEPDSIYYVADKIADLICIPPHEIIERTTETAKRFFKM